MTSLLHAGVKDIEHRVTVLPWLLVHTTLLLARAQESVWWPGLSKDISATLAACAKCRQEPEPEPIQKLPADYFEVREVQYLVVVERYSSWPLVYMATNLSGSLGMFSPPTELQRSSP